jgi:hypothetical protein
MVVCWGYETYSNTTDDAHAKGTTRPPLPHHQGAAAAEQGLKVPQNAAIVRESEATVLRWLKHDLAAGLEGLHDGPRPGRPSEVTAA